MGASDELPIGCDDILVTISHPYQEIEVTLRDWMLVGPGPRLRVAPFKARHRKTGAPLPLTVIPLRYRNDDESRRLIADGKLEDPWPTRYPETSG